MINDKTECVAKNAECIFYWRIQVYIYINEDIDEIIDLRWKIILVVYKKQFPNVTEATGWDSISKTYLSKFVASLRSNAADIMKTPWEEQRLDFDALWSVLEFRFDKKWF